MLHLLQYICTLFILPGDGDFSRARPLNWSASYSKALCCMTCYTSLWYVMWSNASDYFQESTPAKVMRQDKRLTSLTTTPRRSPVSSIMYLSTWQPLTIKPILSINSTGRYTYVFSFPSIFIDFAKVDYSHEYMFSFMFQRLAAKRTTDAGHLVTKQQRMDPTCIDVSFL